MLEQNLQSDQNQYKATRELGFRFVATAKLPADKNADGREDEGRAADDGRRTPNVDREKGKRYAYGQRVDAGGDGEHKHRSQRKIGVCATLLLTLRERLANHICTDKG